jgi:hypothetical protein
MIYDMSLPIHHIDYNKKNNKSDNLISLCFQDHSRTNYNRPYWKELWEIGSGKLEILNCQR